MSVKGLVQFFLFGVALLVTSDAAFFQFRLASLILGTQIDHANINLFGKNIPLKLLYGSLMSCTAFVYILRVRKIGNVRENVLFAIFYRLVSALLLIYLVYVI